MEMVERYDQRRVKDHLKHLVHMLEINPQRDVIEDLIHSCDHKNNVFRFSDCEMTRSLVEISGFMGIGSNVHSKRPIVPKSMDRNKFMNLLKINQMEEESLKSGGCSFYLRGTGRRKDLRGIEVKLTTKRTQKHGKYIGVLLLWLCS